MKLWQKGELKQDDKALVTEKFTVGNDRIWDMRLARFDVLGSLAHAEMLLNVNIISASEFAAIKKGLEEILAAIDEGTFVLEEHSEDIHSQVEKTLTEKIGDAGKRLHTGRSRNDQVLADIKLYLKHTLKQTSQQVLQLFNKLQQLSEQHKNDLLPGYTHLQLAMPSSFGLWFGAYAESLVDDMEMLLAAYKIADKNPLGSGAGYGSAFPLNRTLTTELLGFAEMNYNSVYAQMTRGKAEKATLSAFASVASTLSRFAYDVCIYMNQQFAYISFSDSLTTGSSIMPHKKNPDVFELIRAKCNRLQAAPNEMTLLCNNLPSGYHRDMQLTKDILFPAIDTLQECLTMLLFSLDELKVRKDILNDDRFNPLFSVEELNKLVVSGIPFRDAYKMVGQSINEGTFNPERKLQHTHEGSINRLCNDEIAAMMKKVAEQII
ncbi:MAG: argininosuccinate lyase [Bacteroidia bacterium]